MTTNVEFGDLLEYPLRSGVTIPAGNRGLGVKMLNMGELFRFPRVPAIEMARVDIPTYDPDRTLLRRHDLLFARRSLTLEGAGKCSIVDEVDEPTTWEGSILRARLSPSIAHSPYYFYYFASPQGRRNIETIVEQVAAAGIRGSDLKKLVVPHPDLHEQRAVADVLGAFDDKIAINNKLASTADEWVRVGLVNLVVGANQTKPLGELVANRKELADPNALDPNSDYVGLEHMPRRSMWIGTAGKAASVTSTKARFEAGDILFGKLRPYFHKVVGVPFEGVCSTDVLVLKPSSSELDGFTLASVASDWVVEKVTAASEGTRMPRTSWKDLAAVEVAWPGTTEAIRFSAQVSGTRESVESLLRENQTLSTTRDALLPQLMSGKLRVKDAEKVLEDAGV